MASSKRSCLWAGPRRPSSHGLTVRMPCAWRAASTCPTTSCSLSSAAHATTTCVDESDEWSAVSVSKSNPSTSAVMPNTAHNRVRKYGLGSMIPRSQRLTVSKVVPSCAANSSCDQPLRARASCKRRLGRRRSLTIGCSYDFLCRLCSESDHEAIFLYSSKHWICCVCQASPGRPRHEVTFEKTDKFV